MMCEKSKNSSVKSALLGKYASYFFIALAAILIPALLALRVDAEVAVFITDNHLEEEIVGEVVNDTGVSLVQREKRWSNFEGSVPEGVVVNTIMLRVSWSSHDVVTTEMNSEQSVADGSSDLLLATGTDPVSEDTASAHIESELDDVPDTEIPSSIEDDVVVPEDAPSDTTPLSLDEVTEEPNQDRGDDEEPVVEETVLTEPIEGGAEVEEVFEPVSALSVYPFANASVDVTEESESLTATEPDVVTEEVSEEVIVSESDTVITEEMSAPPDYEVVVDSDIAPVTDVPPVSETFSSVAHSTGTTTEIVADVVAPQSEGVLEFRYTTDGVTWISLGSVEYATVTDATFLFTDLSVEKIPELQISARYVVPKGDDFKIYFEEIRVEAEYTPLLEPVVPTEVVLNDNEPNFAVSAIKADVTEENIRAVVIERGGMFEFWYSVTSPSSGEVVWNKILGGGPVDENAPIAITERTIFWLDRNQQTLYGFGVDKGSIFGVSFENPENKVFLLPFEDARGKKWEALFNANDTTFEFHKVSN